MKVRDLERTVEALRVELLAGRAEPDHEPRLALRDANHPARADLEDDPSIALGTEGRNLSVAASREEVSARALQTPSGPGLDDDELG